MVNNNRNVIIEDINFDEALRYMIWESDSR